MTFNRGEVWSVRGVEHPATILHVEDHKTLGDIVHIGFLSPEAQLPMHMPFSKEALAASVVQMTGYTELGDASSEGIEYWRRELQNSGAGIYSISVRDALFLVME